MATSAFELDRFTAGDERLEVSGRWIGVRGRRFVRPSLTVFIDGHSTRALAELEHKPWAAEDGDEWVAAFPWHGRLDEIEEFELAVAPDLSVRLPPPGGTIRERVLPVVAPHDQVEPAPVQRAPEPPRGEARELRERADAVRHNALAVRDRALADLDEAIAARDRLRSELERSAADRGRLSAELDHLAGERDRLESRHHALELELGRARAELRMAQSDLLLARQSQTPEPAPAPAPEHEPEPEPDPEPEPEPEAPPPRAQLGLQIWSARALAVGVIIAAVIALVIVLTSGQ
jgi:hypothetical protein